MLDWTNNGSAVDPKINAPHSQSENSTGYHIGVVAPSAGTWAGWFAITPDTSATLFHAKIRVPDAKPITGVLDTAVYVQQEMFQDPRIDAMGCGADTFPTETHWTVSLQAGDKDHEIVNQSIYTDDSPNQPTTRECTLITNGSNQLTAYIDGQKVFSSNKMNLNMPAPFQYYLELQTNSNTPSTGSMFIGSFTDYYATTSEKVKIRNAGAGSVVRIVNATSGSILASSTADSNGIAFVDVGRYHMPINANVQVFDTPGVNLLATTPSSPGIYGGDVYDVGTSTAPATQMTVKAVDMTGVQSSPHLFTSIKNGTTTTTGFTPMTFNGFQDRPYIISVSNFGPLVFDHWDDGTKISGRIIAPTTAAVNLTASFRNVTSPNPPLSLTSTTQYTTNVVTPTILGTASPSYSVQLFDGSTPIANPVTATSNGTWSITPPTLSAGNHMISATATNASDTSPTSTPLTMTIDTVNPSVSITGNAQLNRQVTLTGTSLDNDSGIKIVEVSVDNSPTYTKVKTNLPADWSTWSFTTGQLSIGSHHFIVRAKDMAGNQNTNVIDIQITSDTTPPTLTILFPSNNTSTSIPAIPVSGNAADNSLVIKSVKWKVDSGLVSTATGNTTWSFITNSLSVGTHTIWVNATDASDNVATKHIGIIITPNITYPVIVMNDTTVSSASLISSTRQFIGELATPTSVLAGKQIDSITIKLQKVGAPTGIAQVGIFDINRNVVKSFGTIDVSTISTTATDYEFKLLSTDPLYTIKSGDRIGFFYTGGSATVGVNVTPDRVAGDPFDGANSYRVRYEAAWITSTTEDMYMILKQTHGITSLLPGISINDISLTEGNFGTKNFNFTVTRSGNTTGTSSVNYTTSDGTATISNSDYVAKSGKLVFAPSETTKTLTVLVNGDITVEPTETFNVNLSSCVGCNITDNLGVGTIQDDESSISLPVTVMSDTTASFASLISAPRQFIGELATPTSNLVGKKIDSITLKLQKVGVPTGLAQVGVFDTNRNVVKLFGTIDVSTISTTATDYEFKLLSTDPQYAITSGDRIGFKYIGGTAASGVNVTPDRDAADPFDGANSYRVRYEAAWITSTTEDMYMILKQTR